MRWRIYYADGATYSDADGSPFDAPGRGVEIIAQEDRDVGRVLYQGAAYYWWTPQDGWYPGDLFGLWDYLVDPGAKKVVFGRSVSNRAFAGQMQRALTDPYLPAKSARSPLEGEA